MKQFRYIMVTDFDRHWDIVQKSSYPKKMYHGELNQIREKTETIFIKQNGDTGKVEKTWKGYVYEIKKIDDKIEFKIQIEKEIQTQSKYSDYSSGWYIEPIGFDEPKDDNIYYPPFFETLKTTTEFSTFEDLTFCLIKLIGIHTIYK